jgi:hypothetical protein
VTDATQENCAVLNDCATAVSVVGAAGAVDAVMVAPDELWPAALIAATANWYWVPPASPDMVTMLEEASTV